ncbi:MAG: hemerythrin domain-containing protein [Kofleriaceae bacterium]
MSRIVDVLALLTTQHEQLDELLAEAGHPTTRAAAFPALTELLIAHLAVEQEVLYPAIASLFDREVMAEVMVEHCEIKRVLADLLWIELDDPDFTHKLTALAVLLDGHCAWQAERMFSSVEESVEVETRSALGARMQAAQAAQALDSFASAA